MPFLPTPRERQEQALNDQKNLATKRGRALHDKIDEIVLAAETYADRGDGEFREMTTEDLLFAHGKLANEADRLKLSDGALISITTAWWPDMTGLHDFLRRKEEPVTWRTKRS